jgi:peroxin-12
VAAGPAWAAAPRTWAARAAYAAADNARTALVAAVFAFKALEWWFSAGEGALGATAALPPPPPPPRPPPHPDGVGLPEDVRDCPLCRRRRANAAQLASSGYAFCYPCAFGYVSAHGCCPVTLLPAGLDQLRKLYDAT